MQLGSATIRGLCFVSFQSFVTFICHEYAYNIHKYNPYRHMQPIYILCRSIVGGTDDNLRLLVLIFLSFYCFSRSCSLLLLCSFRDELPSRGTDFDWHSEGTVHHGGEDTADKVQGGWWRYAQMWSREGRLVFPSLSPVFAVRGPSLCNGAASIPMWAKTL